MCRAGKKKYLPTENWNPVPLPWIFLFDFTGISKGIVAGGFLMALTFVL